MIAVTALVTGLTAQGCVYIPPVWDLGDAIKKVDQIEVGKTTRGEVLDLLGDSDSGDGENAEVFRYHGTYSDGFIMFGNSYSAYVGLMGEEDWFVDVAFDENGVVRAVSTSIDGVKAEQGDADAQYRLAEQGDPEAQYLYAYRLNDFTKSWRWYCLAANQGHGKSRYAVGNFYRFGLGQVTQDPVKAYLWYTDAEHADIARFREELVSKMTPDQIAEAERLVDEWKPDPSVCDGDSDAMFELAGRFGETAPLRKLAEQGDRDAAFELARKFDEPMFVRTIAGQGDTQAAIELAKRFDDLGPLKKLAEQGDAWAAFNVYEQAIYRKEPTTEALKWLCEAANVGDAEAQRILAQLHRSWGVKEGNGIKENRRVAYMWYTLAAANGADTLGTRSIVAEEMTTEEEAEALGMVRDWKPGQCPAP